jgi:hypothetical protein
MAAASAVTTGHTSPTAASEVEPHASIIDLKAARAEFGHQSAQGKGAVPDPPGEKDGVFAGDRLGFAPAHLAESLGHDEIAGIGGAGRAMPVTFLALGLGGLSLVGPPPSGGFAAKWGRHSRRARFGGDSLRRDDQRQRSGAGRARLSPSRLLRKREAKKD